MTFTPCPKPSTPLRLEQLERRATRRANERREKEQALTRDGRKCRVPGCTWQKKGFAIHAAHLEDKGMGGDKQEIRTERRKLIALCWYHHEGPRSLHSKDLKIEPLTASGTDAICRFSETTEGGWKVIGVN